MKKLLILTLFAAITTCGFSQQGIEVPGMTSCDNAISQFLSTYSIPSATMALGKDGQLVYSRAFGKADLAEQVPTQPYHMFRVASISKPITAIAIMKLAESGAIKLSDNVFGPEGILKNNAYFDSVNATDTRLNTITVQHLLEHTGGWDRDVDCIQGANPPYTWTINHCDPIGFPRYVTQSLNEPNPVSRRALVKFLMLKGLAFEPGTQYAYSNIGYLTLGLVIEEITGQSYESYVKEFVLDPIGACDMYIGKNMRADKREREGEYKGNGFRAPSIYGGALTLPWEYGGWNLEAMDAHGGWIATARDLVRVLCAIDNFSTRPDILTRTSINTMTTASSTNANYAKGWSVNQFNNWWHTGALDGTASIMVRSNNGYTWALILNHRIIDNRSNDFWTDMDGLPWSCIQSTTQWPAHDLFEVPSTNADTISFANGTTTSFDVNWVRGNGEKCIVVASTGSPVDVFPLDGVDYNADADFGSGDDLGGDQYVVYNGAGNSVNVKSLNASETYHFRVFEYNQNSKTGNHALYQLCASPQANAKPSVNVGIPSLADQGIRWYPNPASSSLNIEQATDQLCDAITIYDTQGKVVLKASLVEKLTRISLDQLPANIYIISFEKDGNRLGNGKLVKR